MIDDDGIASSSPVKFGDATAGNGIAFSSNKTQRFGRLVVVNAYGSELIALPVPVQAQYYDGTSWADNTDDVTSHARTVVVGNRDQSFSPVIERLAPDQCLIDFVRISEKLEGSVEYKGICW